MTVYNEFIMVKWFFLKKNIEWFIQWYCVFFMGDCLSYGSVFLACDCFVESTNLLSRWSIYFYIKWKKSKHKSCVEQGKKTVIQDRQQNFNNTFCLYFICFINIHIHYEHYASHMSYPFNWEWATVHSMKLSTEEI